MRNRSLKLCRTLTTPVSILLPWLVWSACAKPAVFKGDIKNLKVSLESAAHSVFLAGRKGNEEVSYSFLPDSAIQSMRLKATPPQTVTLNQIERPKNVDQFIQGHLGDVVQEDFTVSMLDKLDLLLVVDNSSSMGPYQQKLAAGLKPLLSHISNTDWQIMVTTTSALRKRDPLDPTHTIRTYGCPLVNALDPADKALVTRDDYVKDPLSVDAQFAWKVRVGETGDPIEHGLMAAISGLDGECGNTTKSWTRPEAQKAVLMLTDEENCGSDPDQGCDSEIDADPQFFLDRAPKGTKFFALLYDLDRYSECADEGYIKKPDDYRYLIANTGGMEGNICQGHYDATLEEISKNMHPVQRKEFPLTYVPEAETITLLVDGLPWAAPFSISGGSIHFDSPMPANAKVLSIRYNHDPEPLSDTFPLSASVDTSTLSVSINGIEVDPGLYKIDDSKLTFTNTPSALSKITAAYRTAVPLPAIFPLAKDALLETITVTVDSQPVIAFQITGEENRDLVLADAPRDGVPISISYETAETRTVRYPALPYEQDKVVEIKAFDSANQQTIPLEWRDGELIFKREDIANERQVNILYTLTPDSDELALTLAQRPQEGSLKIASTTGSDCVSLASTEGTRLWFPCPAEQLGHLRISYAYTSQIDKSFRMNGRFAPDVVWKAKIDGVDTTDFKCEGNVISFPNQTFEPNTTIEVEVFQPVRVDL